MGGKVNVPISYDTHDIYFNENLAVCLHSSDQVIAIYQLNRSNEMKRLNTEETVLALMQFDVEKFRCGKSRPTQFARKGFKRAMVTKFAKRYSGSAHLVLK